MNIDTIAAIATAMASAGIGIIRISGREAVEVADRVFSAKSGKSLQDSASHTIHYGFIVEDGTMIDEVLVMLMKAPHSYTREDTVEINCHGGVLVMRKILETVIRHGARPAEPGEFTKRAFLNGRMDLTQAESVIDIINSQNDFAWKSSINQLSGALLSKIREYREKIIHETAFIESAIDDPEHYSLEGYEDHLSEIVEGLEKELKGLLDTADYGRVLREGIHTVIVGKPNVGKSSLLNLLVGSERAIVTDIAGTTREVIEEHISLNGISLHIIDTAGIHQTDDIVEKVGVDKAKEYIINADLILYVADGSDKLSEEDYEIARMIKNRNVIVLLNKSDLQQKINMDDLTHISEHIISISAKEGDGIKELSDLITSMFLHGRISFNDEVIITNMRHKKELMNAMESLRLVRESIAAQMPEDFYSIDLINAYESLGNIIGESIEDDLADEIFSKFCMGK